MTGLIRWEERPDGEAGYLGDQYIGEISETDHPGHLLLHCLLPCTVRQETHTPHTTREGAKAFAEGRVIASLMAEISPNGGN